MAKNKSANNKKKKGGRRPRQRARARTPLSLSPVLRSALHLSDPCNAPLSPGAYPGQGGYIVRGTKITPINLVGGETGFVAAFFPGTNNCVLQSFTDPNVGINFSVNQALSPLSGFLQTAASMRSLGACIEVFSTDAVIYINGSIAVGNMSIGSFPFNSPTTGVVTPNQLISQANYVHRLSTESTEVKWRPNVLDDTYVNNNTAPNTELEAGDRNVVYAVVFGVLGTQQGARLTVRTTNILEWLPRFDSGLNIPTTGYSPVQKRATEVVALLDHHKRGWWASHGRDVYEGFKGVVNFGTEALRFANSMRGAPPLGMSSGAPLIEEMEVGALALV